MNPSTRSRETLAASSEILWPGAGRRSRIRPRRTHLPGSQRTGAGGAVLCALFALMPVPAQGGDIFVDDDASPGGSGTSWNSAFAHLQEALSAASAGDAIRVAGGIYKPDRSAGNPGGSGDRAATFLLVDGAMLLGGYAGLANPADPDERDVVVYITTLSGDIGAVGDMADNCYHVVFGGGVSASAVLDGFTVTGGHANGSDPSGRQRVAAGMYNLFGSPTVRNCTFRDNHADGSGGGVANNDGDARLIDCLFEGNSAQFGGGVDCAGGAPVLIRCTFIGNSAGWGGGIATHWSTTTTLVNCRFFGNTGSFGGGFLAQHSGDAEFINCLFTGNTGIVGGAYIEAASNVGFTNCTFSENVATQGNRPGGIFISNSTVRLTNSILWANRRPGDERSEITQVHRFSGSFAPTFSCIDGLDVWTGNGNIGDDPLFVNALGTDGSAGTFDDDLHLLPASPAADTGSNAALPADAEDLDSDADTLEQIPVDADDNARVVNATVDMGAFESPFADSDGDGVPDTEDQCPGFDDNLDADADGVPDDCDTDDDNDGFSDADEIAAGSDPLNAASTPEVCDGVDNDLDGQIDETFPDADLDGVADCVDPDDDDDGFTDSDEIAAGSDPFDAASTPETCDGADNDLDGQVDEGFADTDADGVADCIDIDDDNDGILDEVDVAPLTVSTRFSDGTTSGEVVGVIPPGVQIRDALQSFRGIEVEVTETELLEFVFDCANVSVKTRGPSITVYTCGSLLVEAVSGSASATFTLDGVVHEITVDEGGTATLEETVDSFGDLEAVTVTGGGAAGSVTVNGQTAAPGQAVDLRSVGIDIKPGSYPNSINLGSGGTVPIAIFSTTAFDATRINPLSVSLAGANVRLRGRGTPQVSFDDLNSDGLLDLIVHVETEALELSEFDAQADLTASADTDGDGISDTIIRGLDSVRVVP